MSTERQSAAVMNISMNTACASLMFVPGPVLRIEISYMYLFERSKTNLNAKSPGKRAIRSAEATMAPSS